MPFLCFYLITVVDNNRNKVLCRVVVVKHARTFDLALELHWLLHVRVLSPSRIHNSDN